VGRRVEWATAAAVATATALYFAVIWKLDSPRTFTSFDTYQHFYPNMLYLVAALRDGGRGLLWNPYQSCGAPFFGTLSNGIAYPGNLLFLLLAPDQALLALTVLNLTIGGIFTYALCRELGVGRAGACCGAVVFQLGTGAVDVTTWAPLLGGPYVWLPASMLFCERILRAPTFFNALGLAGALSMALLPGFPQIVFFTYQLIALRVLWAVLAKPFAGRWRVLLMVGIGLVLPPLLTAVQLLPALEMVRASMRGQALSPEEVLGAGALDWARLRRGFTWGWELGNPFVTLPSLLAVNGLLHAATRRAASFYFSAGVLYFLLAFGYATPLYRLYVILPLGALFRDPTRFLWITSFCLAILTALGVEAIGRAGVSRSRLARHGAWAAPALVLLGFSFLSLRGLSRLEWTLGLGIVIAPLLALLVPRRRAALGALVAAIAAYGALAFPLVLGSTVHWGWSLRRQPGRGLLADGGLLSAHAGLFAELRRRMSEQDRVYLVHGHPSFALEPKTASLFRVPSIQNYEPQPTQRAAEYFVMLLSGRIMERIGEFYYPLSGPMPPGLHRRLLDAAAVRYIVADAAVDHTQDVMRPPPQLIMERNGLRVYENSRALPRAMYVPRIEVVRPPDTLLLRLANGIDDLSRVTLVENDPPSGFRGVPPYAGHGSARFVTNEPEHLVLDVDASEHGFLFLSDHNFPGWEATVNSAAVPIQQANFLFRLIEVPAGASRVELRYRPRSLQTGAMVSALTVVLVSIIGLVRRRT